MTMTSILMPVEDSASLPMQFETALLAAAPAGGHIVGLAPRAMMTAYGFGDGMSAAVTTSWKAFEDAETLRLEGAQKAFREAVRARNVAWGDPQGPSNEPTAAWQSEMEAGDEAVGQLARLYNIAVLARPLADAPLPRSTLLETVLFESGRPILVAPPEMPGRLGEVVMIAWNGSTESARAITFAQPFLTTAERVVVLAVDGASVIGPPADQVALSLRRAGIKAESREVRPEGRSTGEAILEEAAKLEADLLVKGAYTHSRLRQMIFGGATSHILEESRLPVLMAH